MLFLRQYSVINSPKNVILFYIRVKWISNIAFPAFFFHSLKVYCSCPSNTLRDTSGVKSYSVSNTSLLRNEFDRSASQDVCNFLLGRRYLDTSMEDIFTDLQFTRDEQIMLRQFAEGCQEISESGNLLENSAYSFHEIVERMRVPIDSYYKESLFLQALWVLFLLVMKSKLTTKDYKYQKLEEFLAAYPNDFDDASLEEKMKLWETANWMHILFTMMPAKKNKGMSIHIVPKVVEAWDTKYVTGSGQTRATFYRVRIYETEGEVTPYHRGKPKARKSVAYRKGKKRSVSALPKIVAVKPLSAAIDSSTQKRPRIPPVPNVDGEHHKLRPRLETKSLAKLPPAYFLPTVVGPLPRTGHTASVKPSGPIKRSMEIDKQTRPEKTAKIEKPSRSDKYGKGGKSNLNLDRVEKTKNERSLPIISNISLAPSLPSTLEVFPASEEFHGANSLKPAEISVNDTEDSFNRCLSIDSIMPDSPAFPLFHGALSRDISEWNKDKRDIDSLEDDLLMHGFLSIPPGARTTSWDEAISVTPKYSNTGYSTAFDSLMMFP